MTYSIIRVEGLSMNPFLQSNDYVLVKNGVSFAPGSLLYVQNKVHRLINEAHLKGDRMIQYDAFIAPKSPQVVLGRVLKNEGELIISNYHHPVLHSLSRGIRWLSEKNLADQPVRPMILALLITVSFLHRQLEPFFPLKGDQL